VGLWCAYSHNCVVQNRRGRFTSGYLFGSIIHLSKANSIDGQLTERSR